MNTVQPTGVVTAAWVMGIGLGMLIFGDGAAHWIGYFVTASGAVALMYLTEGRDWRRMASQTWFPLTIVVVLAWVASIVFGL